MQGGCRGEHRLRAPRGCRELTPGAPRGAEHHQHHQHHHPRAASRQHLRRKERARKSSPRPVPSRREEALPGPTMAASHWLCLRFLAVHHRGPVARHGPTRQSCAGGTGELAGALVAGTGRCHARTFPRWDLPSSAGIPAQDPAGSSPGLVPARTPQALFAPQAVVFPDPSCRRCQETPAPPRCSSAMSQEVFLPPGPAGCRAPAGSCHLRPAAGTLVPPQPRGPGGPHAARPVLHCPALLSSPLLLGHNGQAPSTQHRARGAASPPVTPARGRTGWLCRGGSRAHAALGHAESKRQNHSPTASS